MRDPFDLPNEDTKKPGQLSTWFRELLLNPTGSTGCVLAFGIGLIALFIVAMLFVVLAGMAWRAL
jgi:hypothetical protein